MATLLLTLALGAAACSTDTAPVHYPALQLREELRIQDPTRTGPRSNIVGASLDHDGNLYIMDGLERRILVLDSTGAFQRTIGSVGTSEGSFIMLGTLGIIGDTVWVADPRLGRVTVFDRQGNLLQTLDQFTDLGITGVSRYSLLGILPDGAKLVALDPVQDGPAPDDLAVPFLAVRKDKSVDTMYYLPLPAYYRPIAGTGVEEIYRPYETRPIIGVRRDGGAWVLVQRDPGDKGPAAALIARYSPGNGREWSREIPVTPEVIPKGFTDSIVSALTFEKGQAQHLRAWLRVPRRHPLVTAALISDDDSIWLQEGTSKSMTRWIRLSANGEPNGAVTLRSDALVLYTTNDRLWVLESAGPEQSIVRYRVN